MVAAPRLAVAGHLTLDEVEERGEIRLTPGGAALYVSLTASALGARVTLYSCVGGDYPSKHLEALFSAGIDIRGVEVVEEASTTRYRISYERGRRRLTLLAKAPLLNLREIVGEFDALYLGPVAGELNDKDISWTVNRFRVALDPQGLLRTVKPDGTIVLGRKVERTVLDGLWVLRLSEEEAEAWTGTRDARRAVEIFLEAGVEVVVLSMGARGIIAADHSRGYRVPAYGVRAIDLTGAGDVLGGAMVVELLRGEELKWAAAVGAAAASIVIEDEGPAPLFSKEFRVKVLERAKRLVEQARPLG